VEAKRQDIVTAQKHISAVRQARALIAFATQVIDR